MASPFIGQITTFGFNFAPRGWLLCRGQLLPISQYAALFSLLGTAFGGNGTTNFGLPNLQDNVTVGQGQGPGLSNYIIGETTGTATVTLTATTMPPHTHSFVAEVGAPPLTGTPAAGLTLGRGFNATGGALAVYTSTGTAAALAPTALGVSNGGGQPHNNVQPILGLNWCIATQGVFPTRS
jgi:microcystin-dependent protein